MTSSQRVAGDRSLTRAAILAGLAGMTLSLTPACGGEDLSCGEGTRKNGSKCVAQAPVVEGDAGSGGSEGSGGSAGSGGQTGSGGGPGTGGASSGGASGDGGQIQDQITFGGVTGAAPSDATSILVTWLPAEYALRPDARIRYEIFAAESSGQQSFAAPVAESPPGSTSFLVQGLDATKTYYFVVRAVADRGAAKDENTVEESAQPGADTTAPTFAGITEVVASSARSVTVRWTAATDDHTPAEALSYRVSWSVTESGPLQVGAVSLPGATEVEVSGLPTPETEFYFVVDAVDAAGNVSTRADRVTGSTGADTSAPVFGGCVAVARPTAGGAVLVWDPATDDTTPGGQITYNVYAFEIPVTADTPFETIEPAATAVGVTELNVSGLKSNTFYRYVCRAEDALGNEESNRRTIAQLTLNDGTPPVFAGIVSETHDESNVALTWEAATDNLSTAVEITYAVYASRTPGTQDFTRPILVSDPGATSVNLTPASLTRILDEGEFASNQQYYFVARAQDAAGNTDENVEEVAVKTLVSFSNDVELIFAGNDLGVPATCARVGCHSGADPSIPPQQGQRLDRGFAYDNIVNVDAVHRPAGKTVKRVSRNDDDPSNNFNPLVDEIFVAGDDRINELMKSYVFRKITGTSPIQGQKMPADNLVPLTETGIQTISDWILQGAHNN